MVTRLDKSVRMVILIQPAKSISRTINKTKSMFMIMIIMWMMTNKNIVTSMMLMKIYNTTIWTWFLLEKWYCTDSGGEIMETQMVGVTKSQIIKPFTRDVPDNITPVNVPRKRRLAAVFKSPYVNDFSSGGNTVEDKQNSFAANVKLPFEASITEEVSFEMLHEFAKWVDIGLKGKSTLMSYFTICERRGNMDVIFM
nr:uncharacterized protein LOC104112146 [Nicotiana tomentosiformis]